MRHCPHCDQPNPDEARTCGTCGVALTQETAADPAEATTASMLPAAAPIAPQPPLYPAPPPVTVNVTVAAPAPAAATAPVIVLAQSTAGPGCLVRGLYFVFVGLWLGFAWTLAAWALLVSVIGLPLGLLMLNRLPQVMTLKPVRTQTQVTIQGGTVVVRQSAAAQQPFWLRAVYFLLVGWWLSGLWLGAAWGLVGVSFGLGLPLAFWMFDRTPAIVTLARR